MAAEDLGMTSLLEAQKKRIQELEAELEAKKEDEHKLQAENKRFRELRAPLRSWTVEKPQGAAAGQLIIFKMSTKPLATCPEGRIFSAEELAEIVQWRQRQHSVEPWHYFSQLLNRGIIQLKRWLKWWSGGSSSTQLNPQLPPGLGTHFISVQKMSNSSPGEWREVRGPVGPNLNDLDEDGIMLMDKSIHLEIHVQRGLTIAQIIKKTKWNRKYNEKQLKVLKQHLHWMNIHDQRLDFKAFQKLLSDTLTGDALEIEASGVEASEGRPLNYGGLGDRAFLKTRRNWQPTMSCC